MAQTCAREGKRVGDERDTEVTDESYHFRGIGNQIVSSFMKLRVPGSIDGKEVSFAPSVTPGDILPLVGNDHLIPWCCSIHVCPDECRLNSHLVELMQSCLCLPRITFLSTLQILMAWTSLIKMCGLLNAVETVKRQVPRVVPRKPRVPRKKPPPAYIQLSPALQSELRKLQHAASRGSSASTAAWAKVSRAADRALALLLPDKGPRSIEISTVYNCQDIGFECELEKEQSGATQWIHAKTVGVRFDSSLEDEIEGAEHRGCCIRNAHCDSESHRQNMGQVEQTLSDELTDAIEQLRMASLAERDDPDERSKHCLPRQ